MIDECVAVHQTKVQILMPIACILQFFSLEENTLKA